MTRPPPLRQCMRCDEPVQEEELTVAVNGGAGCMHTDCMIRSVVGGANHLRGNCSCCGGELPPDPPSLSRREAASLAARIWADKLAGWPVGLQARPQANLQTPWSAP